VVRLDGVYETGCAEKGEEKTRSFYAAKKMMVKVYYKPSQK
jgi:hypothetical protein